MKSLMITLIAIALCIHTFANQFQYREIKAKLCKLENDRISIQLPAKSTLESAIQDTGWVYSSSDTFFYLDEGKVKRVITTRHRKNQKE